ncbi:MAG: hypothetical protein DI555_18690 [Novosphingobium pentaromativorans]|uniref:Uncharacterized protein n=1 Tax=Novosphingobium pentaromativorans TaxID=205844 RepID=A0A2W5QDD6_9SPHN|nr:MAG: hypothetical protein DI555_18690 [Novosphingobium pentaromativorans]
MVVVTLVVVFFVVTVWQGTNLPLASRHELAAMDGVAASIPGRAATVRAATVSRFRIMIALPFAPSPCFSRTLS